MPRLGPPSRREFLGAGARALTVGLASAGASTGLSRCRADETSKPPARVTFGFSLYGMRSLKVAEALTACAKIGYDAVELVASDGWPCDPGSLNAAARQDLRRQLSDSGLALTSLMENLAALADVAGHRRNLDRLKAAGELGHALSPDAPPVVETILGGSPAQWDAVKDRMAAALSDWATAGEAAKTMIAVKPHVAGALHTPEGAKWLVEKVGSPWLRLVYDFSHFRLRGLDLKGSLQALLPHTAFVHVKDAQGSADKVQFLLPGAGDVDYGRYFQLLREGRYRGSVMVEVSGQLHTKPDYDPLQAARASYEKISPAFDRAGLRRKS